MKVAKLKNLVIEVKDITEGAADITLTSIYGGGYSEVNQGISLYSGDTVVISINKKNPSGFMGNPWLRVSKKVSLAGYYTSEELLEIIKDMS